VADARLLARLRTRRRPPGLPAPPPVTTLLSVGDQGPGVRRLQAGLRRSGFTVTVDGAFGPRTRLAVARLQRRLGLRVNGAVDAKLLRRLGASRARHLEVFPVQAPHSFQNDFGAPRHQGPHEGIDVIAPRGAPVVAVASGVVERLTRRQQGLGGIWLWLRDDAGTAYYYAHLSSIQPGIAPGTRVVAGGRLGAVGRTGDARGGVFHLHFEMHPAGRGAVNPYAELRAVDPASAV
jgi:murein DD-endopeptidase MepM/ murein hydrolase activator NlpD